MKLKYLFQNIYNYFARWVVHRIISTVIKLFTLGCRSALEKNWEFGWVSRLVFSATTTQETLQNLIFIMLFLRIVDW
jgi:hypothetical protein